MPKRAYFDAEKMAHTKNLIKRLTPLYIAAFFQGFVLWYTVEKLFMHSIGFDDAGIGMMIAVYSVVVLIFETPSGILADRWSRKGILIIASIALALSSLIGGLSYDIWLYLLCTVAWGIFFALYSGTYDSIVYDTVYEETGNSHAFEKLYGRVKAIDSAALIVSSLLGGVLANLAGIRSSYFLTIPFALFAIVALIKFREPKLYKSGTYEPIGQHIRSTFRAILKTRKLLPVLSALVLTSTLSYIFYEFSQLWLIALAVPVMLFGVANAALLTGTGMGGVMASWIKYRNKALPIILAILLSSILCLIFFKNILIAVIAQVVFGATLTSLTILFNRLLHDELPSTIRAGAASAVSTISRILVIPLALLFGYVSRTWSIFNASWLLFGIAVLIVLIVIATNKINQQSITN